MTCAFNVFEEDGHLRVPRRDDLSLLKIASRLADMFAGDIANPAEPSEILCKSWTADQRRNVIRAAAAMHDELDTAINHCYLPDVAVT